LRLASGVIAALIHRGCPVSDALAMAVRADPIQIHRHIEMLSSSSRLSEVVRELDWNTGGPPDERCPRPKSFAACARRSDGPPDPDEIDS
jgi:hypothetical protein